MSESVLEATETVTVKKDGSPATLSENGKRVGRPPGSKNRPKAGLLTDAGPADDPPVADDVVRLGDDPPEISSESAGQREAVAVTLPTAGAESSAAAVAIPDPVPSDSSKAGGAGGIATPRPAGWRVKLWRRR